MVSLIDCDQLIHSSFLLPIVIALTLKYLTLTRSQLTHLLAVFLGNILAVLDWNLL